MLHLTRSLRPTATVALGTDSDLRSQPESRFRTDAMFVTERDCKQDLALQLDALERPGCEHRFTETASGALKNRPELQACLDHLRAGDTHVVWRLDRLGRSLRHLIETIAELE